jgi:hypothetical protein
MPDEKKAHTASAAMLAHIDELLDEALKQTFPASDPIAINIERAGGILSYAPEEFSKLFGLHIAELDTDYLPSPPKLKLVAG